MSKRERGFSLILALLALAAFALAAPRPARAACSTISGSPISALNGKTAALIETATGQSVTGAVDATGCDIGVYWAPGSSGYITTTISGTLSGTSPSAAVVVDGASVDVLGSTITAGLAGSSSVGILYVDDAACPLEEFSECRIEGNAVSGYGKTAIVAKNPGTIVAVEENIVTGAGPIATVAQNGIEFGDGATGDIIRNQVSANSYTGTDTFATGILLYGGPGYDDFGFNEGPNYTIRVKVLKNSLNDDDVGVFLSNKNTAGSNDPPSGGTFPKTAPLMT